MVDVTFLCGVHGLLGAKVEAIGQRGEPEVLKLVVDGEAVGFFDVTEARGCFVFFG